MKYPKYLQKLIEQFQMFPGVGKKTAERFALYVLNHTKSSETESFAEALLKLHETIRPCPTCGFFTDQDTCEICKDMTRDPSQILVVEDAKDVIVFENTHVFHGHYHVLNGAISPSEGIGPDSINLKSLFERLKNESYKELILATNLSEAGETTALYIKSILEKTNIKVTRIGYGLPAGGNIAYADEITLNKALEGRKDY